MVVGGVVDDVGDWVVVLIGFCVGIVGCVELDC